MKRFFTSLVVVMVLLFGFTNAANAMGTKILIKSNGQKRQVTTASVEVNGFNLYCSFEPYVDVNRTFVPIRELTELMGANVEWDQNSKSATIRMQDKDVKLKINSSVVYVNGQKTNLDKNSVPRLVEYVQKGGACKTMVPLRFLSESLGFDVQWDQGKRLAGISNGAVQAPAPEPAPAPAPEPEPLPQTDATEPTAPPVDTAVPNAVPGKGGNGKVTVVLDPGHGGSDSGAVGVDGTTEKALNMRLSKKVEALLRQKGYNVIMTRTRDEFIKLYDRANMANDANADIFMSIHFNSAGSSKAYGIEVLYASEDDVAAKKDDGDQTRLAREVLNAVLSETGAHSRGIKNRPDLAVLRKTEMTAALIEGGFMSNPSEMSKIKQDSYLDKLARGITKGIESYDRKYL